MASHKHIANSSCANLASQAQMMSQHQMLTNTANAHVTPHQVMAMTGQPNSQLSGLQNVQGHLTAPNPQQTVFHSENSPSTQQQIQNLHLPAGQPFPQTVQSSDASQQQQQQQQASVVPMMANNAVPQQTQAGGMMRVTVPMNIQNMQGLQNIPNMQQFQQVQV